MHAKLMFWRGWGEAIAASRHGRAQELVGAALTAASVLFVFFVGVWGLNGPFPDGHYASAGAIGTSAANMLRWKTLFPVYVHLSAPPTSANYYMHHPLGLFALSATLIKLFGEVNWVLRLPAVIYATLSPFFLYRTARAIWGPLEGGLAALAFVSLPITLGFANYLDLEGPVVFGCLVATWGYVRFHQTSATRYALASVLALLFAVNHDWEAYIWLGVFLGLLFVKTYLVPQRLTARIDQRAFGRYWALMCLAGLASLVVAFALLVMSDRFYDLIASYHHRTTGKEAPLKAVLAARAYRIELMFTPIAIFLGKLALPVIFARFVIKRSHLELIALPLFVMATFYYVVFKSGADVHIFWPRPFSGYFPFAIAALAATAREVATWLVARASQRQAFPPRLNGPAAIIPWMGLVLLGPPLGLILRDGASLIRLARETGGRFIEVGLDSDVDMVNGLHWFLARYPHTEKMGFHPQLYINWGLQWEIRPRVVQTRQPLLATPPVETRLYMLDTRLTPAAELRQAAGKYHVQAIGPFWFIDRSQPRAPLSGFQFHETEPGLLASLSRGATEPIRQIVSDPWVTWEWRDLLGQDNVVPRTAPQTLNQLRIAHNIAVATGDVARRDQLRQQLAAQLNLPVRATFDNRSELLGAVHHRGAQRRLTLYFLAGKFDRPEKFLVRASVIRRQRLSSLPPDTAEVDIADSPTITTDLWRPGHIYEIRAVYRKRPGTEKLSGSFSGGAKRVGGPAAIDLLTL